MTHWIISSLTFQVNVGVFSNGHGYGRSHPCKNEYLVVFVWVWSVTGAIAAGEVVIVAIPDVLLVLDLREKQVLRKKKAQRRQAEKPVYFNT